MTSQNNTQPQERVFAKHNDNGEVERYIKELTWNVEPYLLVVRYFSQDKDNFTEENKFVGIQNDSTFDVDLYPVDNLDGDSDYSSVEVSLPSNLAETAEELEELSVVLQAAAKAKRLFTKVLTEQL